MDGRQLRKKEFTFDTDTLYKYFDQVKMGNMLPYEFAEQRCVPGDEMDYVYSINIQVQKYGPQLRELYSMKQRTLNAINNLLGL